MPRPLSLFFHSGATAWYGHQQGEGECIEHGLLHVEVRTDMYSPAPDRATTGTAAGKFTSCPGMIRSGASLALREDKRLSTYSTNNRTRCGIYLPDMAYNLSNYHILFENYCATISSGGILRLSCPVCRPYRRQ
jgi:hypothetical protein